MANFSFGFDLPGHEDTEIELDDMETKPTQLIREEGPIDSDHPAIEVLCPVDVANSSYTTGYLDIPFTGDNSGKGVSAPQVFLRKVDVDQHPREVHAVAIPMDHDIVPSTYGGGYKTWECSMDLAQYMLRTLDVSTSTDSCVLELGCGHGIPGIAALKHLGYASGLLNDLNAEVLRDTTWPNVVLNSVGPKAQCIAGHWQNVSKALDTRTFDLVLSAETAYSDNNVALLAEVIRRHLARLGKALVSTKRFYFGLGGGTSSLIKAAAACGLSCRVVWSIEDGVSNIRDILELKHNVGEGL